MTDGLKKRLGILMSNTFLLIGSADTVISFTQKTNAITGIENVNMRRLAAEIYVTAQAIGKRKIETRENHFRVSAGTGKE